MVIQIPLILIVVGLFVIASVTLFFIYKFGIKEKSYEEALAEQRQQTNSLLGIKPKKKSKKAAKKAKEKQSSIENETADDESESADTQQQSNGENQKQHHVEFKEKPEEVLNKEVVPSKKRIKKDKVRPILIHKERIEDKVITEINIVNVPPVNHFEELHPKDEFELLLSQNTNDELVKQEPGMKAVKIIQSHQPKVESPKITKKQSAHQVETSLPPSTAVVDKGKDEKRDKEGKHEKEYEKREKEGKHEKDSEKREKDSEKREKEEKRTEIAPPLNGLSGSNVGKEKKKKKSEFNTLQQLTGDKDGPNMSILLNLVRKAELSRSEVQILIDLLLNKQHEAPVILDEWSEGKSDPVQKLKKQLAEKEKALIEEQEALAGAQAKLRDVRAEQLSERSQLQQKIRGYEEVLQAQQLEVQASNNRLQTQNTKLQQLQAQLNEELMKSHKLREEHAAFQMQRQQFELRIAQAQETEVVIAQLRNEIQELSSHNQQLRLECQRFSEENSSEKERSQAFISQLKFQKDLEQETEHSRQLLEDTRIEIEHKLEKALRQEGEMKLELSRLNNAYKQQAEELKHIEVGKNQFQDEVHRLQKLKEESDKIVYQYKTDLQKLQEEKSKLETTQANGLLEESKAHKIEILNLHNELTSVKAQLQQTENKYEIALDNSKTMLNKIENELKEQIEKNNKLRTRNWKVMEALNAAESRIKTLDGNKQSNINLDQIKSEILTKELVTQKEFIQRLFPEIKELGNISPKDFQIECENHIKKYISNLQEDKQKCTANVSKEIQEIHSYYQSVIDKAEKQLQKLYSQIGQEEINWRMQLAEKNAELETLKRKHTSELEDKLSTLKEELKTEQNDKKRIIEEFQQLKNSTNDSSTVATIEKLSEEVNYLREQLHNETSRNNGVDVNPKTQNCNPSNGSSLIQHCLSSSSSIASSVNEVSIKKTKNKKKKKKGNGN